MQKDVRAEVVYNAQISSNYYRLGLKTGWGRYEAGQFVMVRIPSDELVVRRPFSISRGVEKDTIEIVYKVIGRGTAILRELSEGESIDVLGPLGNSFKIPKVDRLILVAGGFGVAPFMGVLKKLKKSCRELRLYYGGGGLEDILFLEEFDEAGIDCHITTEDGSLGHKGLVTELLLKDIAKTPKNSVIFGCGPKGLLDRLIGISREHRIPAELSYETYMGCGIGICLGCAVKTKEGYKRACKDGPVFNASELVVDSR